MASARISPISASPLAEMVATCESSPVPLTSREIFSSSATTAATERSIPSLISMGLAPAATSLDPVA